MEARLLCLENTPVESEFIDRLWSVTNGTGVLISQAQVQQVPLSFPAAGIHQRFFINCLTAILGKEPFSIEEAGWSKWYVGT